MAVVQAVRVFVAGGVEMNRVMHCVIWSIAMVSMAWTALCVYCVTCVLAANSGVFLPGFGRVASAILYVIGTVFGWGA